MTLACQKNSYLKTVQQIGFALACSVNKGVISHGLSLIFHDYWRVDIDEVIQSDQSNIIIMWKIYHLHHYYSGYWLVHAIFIFNWLSEYYGQVPVGCLTNHSDNFSHCEPGTQLYLGLAG